MLLISLLILIISLKNSFLRPPPPLYVEEQDGQTGEDRDDLPVLNLPYASYRASSYDAASDNIRFAAPPVGDLRFAKPAPPEKATGIQDGSYGPSCVQDVPLGLFNLGVLDQTPFGSMVDNAVSYMVGGTSEDCLFLYLQVPGKAVRDPAAHKLPVVLWIHGGAYTFGTKNHVNAKGIMKHAAGNMIFAASNYRLGAYGWLAGKTMEKAGTANLGLYDQRAALQWLHDHIHLVGGNKAQISAWGESAGAGSILHHLTAFGGTQNPLFSKAVLISPAFEILYDREGQLEDTFRNFAVVAGCPMRDLDCLRAADPERIRRANSYVIDSATSGSTNLGPASDGQWVRQIAGLEFQSGHYWKYLDSLIVSHVADEAALFTSMLVKTDAEFERFLDALIPTYAKPDVPRAILEEYPASTLLGSPFSSTRGRWKAFIRDSTFTCNVRSLIQAYAGKAYAMQYSVGPGLHSSYLLTIFFDNTTSGGFLDLNRRLLPKLGNIAPAFQSYMTSHAIYGSPNPGRLVWNIPPAVYWPPASPRDDTYENVLELTNSELLLITDGQLSARSDAHCDFVNSMNQALVNLGGYAPPETFVGSSVGRNVTSESASARYA